MRHPWIAAALLPVAGLLVGACTVPASGSQAAPAPTTTTVATTTSKNPSTTVSSPHPTAPACQPNDMKALPAIQTAATLPGTVAVRVEVANTGAACTIAGLPKVAITGLPPATGPWPHKDLKVTASGKVEPLTLAPGGRASAVMSFTPVVGGKCASGVEPSSPPILLVGVSDGLLPMSMADGTDFAECGDTVTTAGFQPL